MSKHPTTSFELPAGEPERAAPRRRSASRIDTLPEGFAKILRRKPVEPGDVIGDRYRLISQLGAGAMGQVFVAENLAINRRVAVKLLKPELLEDAEFRKRFQKEAEAVAAIEHPYVARFLDLVVGDPTFLVTEYVEGATLAQTILNETRVEPARAVNIARRLCAALEAVHAAGVIHRDLKPGNVLLAQSAEEGEVPKLIDFGLAKRASTTAANEDPLTRTGQIVGTPHYMSPEQISGKPVDLRADIYSLGCLLYELLAGLPPFAGGEDVEVLFRQVTDIPPPLSEHAPVPPAIERVMLRALSKKPDERFATMKAFAEALREAVEPPAPPRAQSSRPTFSAFALAGALGIVGAGAGLVAGYRLAHRPVAGGALVVSSSPPGAQVTLDGVLFEDATPALLRGLAAGRHVVKVGKPGYDAVEQVTTLAADERSLMQIVLPSPTRSIDVQTVPAGARVRLDGKLVAGQTPLMVTLTIDDFHELSVERSGYLPLETALKPESRDPVLQLQLQPERQARGTVFVDADRGSRVFIDGEDSGFSTPTTGLHLSLGKHQIELRDAQGVVGARTQVTIAQGDIARLMLDFRAPSR